MDNETKKLLRHVDDMGSDNRALFEAIMMLDAAPQGKRLRMIKNVNMHILERKLDERGSKERRSKRIGELNEFHAKEADKEGSKKGKARAKQQKENPGAGEDSNLSVTE